MSESEPVDLERGVMIASKIEECFEAAMRLFGNAFREKTKPIRLAVDDLMKQTGCNAVSAGLAILKLLKEKDRQSAMGTMLVCAVVYDVMENSK